MKTMSRFFSLLALIAVPVSAATPEISARTLAVPGTVYTVQHEHGRVHVMDHQERIFVVSNRHPVLRCRNRNVAGHQLRAGDKVWFSTLAHR